MFEAIVKDNYATIDKVLEYFVLQVSNCHDDDALSNLVADTLQDNEHSKEVLNILKVAMMCIRARALKRPYMSTVLEMLLSETEIDKDTFHKLQIAKQRSSCSPSTISKLNSQDFLHFSQLN